LESEGPLALEPQPPPVQTVGVATRPGGDLAEELDTLVAGLVPLPDEEVPPSPAQPAVAPVPSAPARSWRLVAPLATVGILGVLGVAAYFLWSTLAPTAVPPPAARARPVSPPVPATATPSPVAEEVGPGQEPSAGLAIDFDYPLKDGRLSIWIDGKLSLEQDLTGRMTKNLVGMKTHKGSLEKTLRVEPGRHEVRVRVAWEDNVKEETLAATFKAGSTRVLEIRLGRIRKNLSVDWK
jgi:hypothetical protein